MHVTIYPQEFTSKPQQAEIFQLRQCANLECKDMSIEQLADVPLGISDITEYQRIIIKTA